MKNKMFDCARAGNVSARKTDTELSKMIVTQLERRSALQQHTDSLRLFDPFILKGKQAERLKSRERRLDD